jgi:4'-phosphopantetheinyl transferase EntD
LIEIGSPFPTGVGFAIVETATAELGQLTPQEVAGLPVIAIERRRREFAAGRIAARQALAGAGGPSASIPIGDQRQPIFPAGFVGSITHKLELAAAVAAPDSTVLALGLDLESMDRPVSAGIASHVCVPSERAWVEDATSEPERDLRLRRLFSAKESLFKALFPLECRWFGYHDAELEPRGHGFSARLLVDVAPGAGFASGAAVEVATLQSGAWVLTHVMIRRTRS